jgi:hypothetical protein
VASWDLPAGVLSQARRAASAVGDHITALGGRLVGIDADELLTGRAALLGLEPPARISSGGATRLIAAADGWFGLTLSRAEDREAVPALLESPGADGDPWGSVVSAAPSRTAADIVARARLLGMPAAVLGETAPCEPAVVSHGAAALRPITDLLVADLSSMWAGPLCGRLLAAAGATVVKVESPGRPDGTRNGDRGFFDWMNSEKLCYSVDFDSEDIASLLRAADVVIEGSRPAALARRGLSAEEIPARPGRVWLRISGYGVAHPDRVAFGDDAAVAGGLVNHDRTGPVFCGDAIADPLTGLAAAAAVLDALREGGGAVIDVAMAATAAAYAGGGGVETLEVEAPALPSAPAHELGTDNIRVRELIESRLTAC